MKIVKMLLLMLVVLAMAAPVWSGPNTRTIDIEAYKDVTVTFDVPYVLDNPDDPVNESLCPYTIDYEWMCSDPFEVCTEHHHDTIQKTKDITSKEDGTSNNFRAPDGTTSVIAQKEVCGGLPSCAPVCNWVSVTCTQNGASSNWNCGKPKDNIRNVVATYNVEGKEVCDNYETACLPWDWYKEYYAKIDCPPESVSTHTVSNSVTFQEVVTEVYSGDTITVRGHIWTRNPKPVTYWYLAERVNDPSDPKFIARSAHTDIPEVEGVYSTDSWSFTAPDVGKDTVVRIFLKIKKVDGTLGSIRTKVIVHPRPQYEN